MLRKLTLRIVLLVLVVVIFAVSSGLSFFRHAETSKMLEVTLKTGAWAASELEKDLLKLVHSLELFQFGQSTPEELELRYELFWSRLNVLKTGDETSEIRQLEGAAELLINLERTLRVKEQSISKIVDGDSQAAAELIQELKQLVIPVRQLSVFSFNGKDRILKLQLAKKLQYEFGVSLIGLLVSGLLLVIMLLQQSARNREQALHDSLTGLPNRKFFKEQLKLFEARCARTEGKLAVHIIDLNDFKNINDTLGHTAGDKLLVEIANRLRSCVRQHDVVARIGGDEFAVIQEGPLEGLQERAHDIDIFGKLASRICEQIAKPLVVENNQVYPSTSIGISVYPNDTVLVDQLMINADIAMYRAKKEKGLGYRFFEPEMNAVIQRRKGLSDDLRRALEDDHLMLFYQPIVDLESGLIDGVEALLRWQHESYGYISPLEIVSVAEQFALAEELNSWVLRRACQQSQHWVDQGFSRIVMNVNISPAMYILHDLAATVEATLRETGMPADLLVLEVTEDTTMQDIESSPDIIKRLCKLGVSLALDDFGTGYSSLSHLRKLPFQKLKIDKSFIQDLNNRPKDLRFIKTIISLAKTLNLQVVAEGIELEENLHDLLAEGCRYGQGYLFSRPVPAEEIAQLLQQQAAGKRPYDWIRNRTREPVARIHK